MAFHFTEIYGMTTTTKNLETKYKRGKAKHSFSTSPLYMFSNHIPDSFQFSGHL